MRRDVRWSLRIAVAAPLAAAGVAKLVDLPAFARAAASYDLWPTDASPTGAGAFVFAVALLPWLELAAAAALVTGLLRRGGVLLAVVLGGVFCAARCAALARDAAVSTCGCLPAWMGPLDGPGASGLALPLGITAAAVLLLLRPPGEAPPRHAAAYSARRRQPA